MLGILWPAKLRDPVTWQSGVYGIPKDVPKLTRCPTKVTLEEIREYCQMVFKPERMALAVVGDYEKLPFELK